MKLTEFAKWVTCIVFALVAISIPAIGQYLFYHGPEWLKTSSGVNDWLGLGVVMTLALSMVGSIVVALNCAFSVMHGTAYRIK